MNYKSTIVVLNELLCGIEPGEEEKLRGQIQTAMDLYKVGDKVKIKYTSYTGNVTGFNDRLGGLYTGARYPLLVEITSIGNSPHKKALGRIFEYGIEQIEKL